MLIELLLVAVMRSHPPVAFMDSSRMIDSQPVVPPQSLSMASQEPLVKDIRTKASHASGAETGPQSWILSGTCKYRETDEQFELAFGSRLRFKNSVIGPLQLIFGFDGQKCWGLNWSGVAHYVDIGNAKYNELLNRIISGNWSLPASPISIEKAVRDSDDYDLTITLPTDRISARLIVSQKTMLPVSLSYRADSGDETWEFDGYQRFSSRTFPTQILDKMPGQTDTYTILSAKQTKTVDSTFELPHVQGSNAAFDSRVNASVDIKSIGGYMFVKPKVDGKESGWFFLDTGAEVMCIDPKLANDLGAKVMGHEVTSGVVATINLPICRTNSFSLGPITLSHPTFLELDMSSFTKAFGIEISGICGYDFLAHAILDIDPIGSKLTLYQKAVSNLPDGLAWQPIKFSGQIPCSACEFDQKNSGVFSLDTGSGSTVDFYSPTVARLSMASNRPTTKAQTGGAGGSTESLTVTIDSFVLGGHRFDHPEVGLQTTKTGVFASSFLDGNVGMGLMSHFRMILDYPQSRMAFIWEK